MSYELYYIYKLYLPSDLIGLSIPKQPVSHNNYIVVSRIMIYNNQLISLYSESVYKTYIYVKIHIYIIIYAYIPAPYTL